MNILKHTQHLTTVLLTSLVLISSASSFNAKAINPECHPPGDYDPLIIDLGQDGIHLGPAGSGVYFDLAGDGQALHLQWTAAYGDEAFIALDRNGNGIVDDGSELFTNYNLLLLEHTPAPNGFADLAQYDHPELGNDDGLISQADLIWSQLKLWKDSNADGISTLSEMYTPQAFNIEHFNTVPKVNNRRDDAGNLLPLWSWAKKPVSHHGNRHFKMVDVFFKPLF